MTYVVACFAIALIAVLKFSKTGKRLRRKWRNYRKEKYAINRALGHWVPDKFGNTFLVRKADQFVEGTLLREGAWESEIAEVLAAFLKPGDHAIVFGTHVGVHAVNMARLIGSRGHLWGFEANPETQKFLRINLLLNDIDNVTVVPNAVCDRACMLSFVKLHGNSGGSQIQLGRAQKQALHAHDSLAQEIQVTSVRADDVLANSPPIDFLLMDIEGAEPRAMLGSEKLINQSPNMVILQEWMPSAMSPHMPLEEYMSFLAQLGFVHFFEVRRASGGHAELIYINDTERLLRTAATNVLISRHRQGVIETLQQRTSSGEAIHPA